MKRLFPYILILLFLFTACNSGSRNDQADDATVIPLNLSSPEKELALSEFVDSVSTIRLTLPDSLFFGQVSNLLIDKENIYAKDSKQQVVFRFNKSGEFLNTIGRRGSGPGEYPHIGKTFLGNNCIYIDHLASRHIYSYAPNGDFIRSFSIPFSIVYDNILALPDENFLCYRLGKPGKGLWTMNDRGEVVDTILTYTRKYIARYRNSQWTHNKSSMYVIPQKVNCTLMTLSKKKCERHTCFNRTSSFWGNSKEKVIV